MYTLSLLTSSTRRPLGEIRDRFVESGLADSVELYLGRLTDRIGLSLCGPDDLEKSPAYIISKLGYPDGKTFVEKGIQDHATSILRSLGSGHGIKCLTTYFPEITSADSGLREHAINALEVAVRLADKLEVPYVEFVGGRSDEECDHDYTRAEIERHELQKADCEIVMSYQNYVTSDVEHEIPVKAEWLISGLQKVHDRLTSRPTDTTVRLLLEMEPGPLFVLSRRHTVNHILEKTAKCKAHNSDLPFVGLNCDIGHFMIMTYNQTNPEDVWNQLFRGIGKPSDLIGNFHVSCHPYCRVHLDNPPTDDPDYRIPQTVEEGFEGQWGVPKDLLPWLNCVLCVSEHRPSGLPANLSLELEAASRDELAVVGLQSIRKAMDKLIEERDPSVIPPTCECCPQCTP